MSTLIRQMLRRGESDAAFLNALHRISAIESRLTSDFTTETVHLLPEFVKIRNVLFLQILDPPLAGSIATMLEETKKHPSHRRDPHRDDVVFDDAEPKEDPARQDRDAAEEVF